MVLCTLFDSNYLDKGLALYYSLCKATRDFKLYIFAFDTIAEKILDDLALKKAIVIPYAKIENDTLRRLKKERTRAEFCWTCTPIIIEYVLDEYKEKDCTYIDADMFFYGDPNILYEEIVESECSVGIAPHRFKRDAVYYQNIKNNGEYCVHFNTFFNDKRGLQVLRDWKEQCIECCTERPKDGKLGDQKYVETWPHKYDSIHIMQHLGGGVAPWNIKNFMDICIEDNKLWLLNHDKSRNLLIFYHFEAMKYLPHNYVYLNIWGNNRITAIQDIVDLYNIKIKRYIYLPYLHTIEKIRSMLKKRYNITFEHMIVDAEHAQTYLPDIHEGLFQWILKRKNVWHKVNM